MPWSGSSPNQTFSRTNGVNSGSTTWAQDEAASVGITSARHDSHDQDVASGLNSALKKDGGNKPSADIDWGGYGITNLGKLSSATEASIAGGTTTNVLGQSALFVAIISSGATITSLGTGAKTIKVVRFADVNTLTHNATSLILPGAANITTAAGDAMIVTSDASSNARVVAYQKANGQSVSAGATDIVGQTGLTAPAVDDSLIIYDLSATTNKKIALSDLWKVIDGLTAETSPDVADEVSMYDASEGATNKITLANLWKVLNTFTEDTGPDLTADFVATYDASATGAKKVLLRNLGQIVDWTSTTYTTNTDLSTTIPLDDTTPTSSEGTQIMSLSLTPKKSTNKILAIVSLHGATTSGDELIASLLRSTTTIHAQASRPRGATDTHSMAFFYIDSPATTSSTTYNVRVGGASSTVRMNGSTSGRYFGGADHCSLILVELAA